MAAACGGHRLRVLSSVRVVLPEAGPVAGAGLSRRVPLKWRRPKAVVGVGGDGQRGAARSGGGPGPGAGRPAGPAEGLPAPVGWGLGTGGHWGQQDLGMRGEGLGKDR